MSLIEGSERLFGLNTEIFNFQTNDPSADGHITVEDHPLANDPSLPQDTSEQEGPGEAPQPFAEGE